MRNFFLSVVIILASIIPSSGVFAATIHAPGGFSSIQEALDAAGPHDTVIVEEGVYAENIVIRKPVTLVSAKGPKATVISAALPDKPAIKIEGAAEVSLSGFTANGSRASGILLSNAVKSVVTNNRAVDNANGIVLTSSHENTLSENIANSNDNYGIYLDRSNGNVIENNTANSNRDKGFFVSRSDRNRIINNNANLNTWDGMNFWSSHGNLIKDNLTLRNAFGMVLTESDGNEVDENTTLPNIFLILPIFLIYLGIVTYIVQKNILRLVYRS